MEQPKVIPFSKTRQFRALNATFDRRIDTDLNYTTGSRFGHRQSVTSKTSNFINSSLLGDNLNMTV